METNPRVIKRLKHSGRACHFVITPDKKHLIVNTSGVASQIQVWSLLTYKMVARINERAGRILSLALTADGRYLISGNQHKSINIWNTADWSFNRSILVHNSYVAHVVTTNDSRYSISTGYDGYLKIVDLESDTIIQNYALGHHYCSALAVSKDDRIVVACVENRIKVLFHNRGRLRLFREINHRERDIYSVAITPDDMFIVCGGSGGIIKIWSVLDGSLVREINTDEGDEKLYTINQLMLTSNGKKIIALGNSFIKVWNLSSGELIDSLTGRSSIVSNNPDDLSEIRFTLLPDEKRIICGGVSQSLILNIQTLSSSRRRLLRWAVCTPRLRKPQKSA